MKKIFCFLLLLFMSSALMAQTPQHYNYSSAGIANSFPFNMAAGKMVQWVIGPGEYNQPTPAPSGNVTKFYFFVAPTYPLNSTYTSFYIRMGRSSITSITGSFYTGPMDTVFKRTSYTINTAAGTWYEFTLDQPFYYRSDSSIVIEIGQCASTQGTGFSANQTTIPTRRVYSVGGCPFVYGGPQDRVLNSGLTFGAASCNYGWTIQTSGVTTELVSAKALSSLVGWVSGDAAVVRKTIDGQTWTNANPNPGVITGDIYALEALDANTAWVTTAPGATFVYKTTNGGNNWVQQFTQAGGFINGIVFINANTGILQGDPVGGRWTLFRTTNGGTTWDSSGMYLPQAGTEAGWNNCLYAIGNTVWFGTNNTRVYKSTNFGVGGWSFSATTGSLNTYAIHFNDNNTGYTGGNGMFRTTNGGTTWNTLTVPGTGNMTAIEGLNSNVWVARGTTIYMSTNDGVNFVSATTGTATIRDIDFAVDNGCAIGWSVGTSGNLKKMSIITGISNSNNNIPENYSLAQNYPNPFNPATMIAFTIPKAGNVEIKVYDVLGREVAVVLNEFRQPGNYSIGFDGTELASGIYLYTLRSGDFVQTKKMTLIK